MPLEDMGHEQFNSWFLLQLNIGFYLLCKSQLLVQATHIF